jgi:hypothetical protein
MPERNPSVGYRTTVFVVVFFCLLIYVLGVGPFIGAASRNRLPRFVVTFGLIIYSPLTALDEHGPKLISDGLRSYVGYWRERFAHQPSTPPVP